MSREGKPVVVYEVLFDGDSDGPAGPAGDGTFVRRFRSEREATSFAKQNTCYGREAKAIRNEVSRRLAQRWGMA